MAKKIAKPVKSLKTKKKELPSDIARDDSEVAMASRLSDIEKSFLRLIKKRKTSVALISEKLEISAAHVIEIASKLHSMGYDCRYEKNGHGGLIHLNTDDDAPTETLKLSDVNQTIKVAFLSGLRMGSYQSQVSLTHWLYQKFFEPKGVSFVVLVGELVVGKPTVTLRPDIFKLTSEDQVDYAVAHYPISKKIKTYVLAARREIAFRCQDGFSLNRAICSRRDDLVDAGELERDFDIHGVKIRVMNPWDDNHPKGKSYGVQKIVDGTPQEETPNIFVFGGSHLRMEIPDYGPGGCLVLSVPSLHTKMKRQSKKGVHPRVGCLMVELNFQEGGVGERKIDYCKDVKAYHVNLDDYVVKDDWCNGASISDKAGLTDVHLKVLSMFVDKTSIREGALSRDLNVSKKEVRKIVDALVATGADIRWDNAQKCYGLERVEKETFKSLPMTYEDVFGKQSVTKFASGACTHLNSKQDMPPVLRRSYEDAAESGCRAIFHAGDNTDGDGNCGYRGHIRDVRNPRASDAEDYCVKSFPIVDMVVNRPIERSVRMTDENGRLYYVVETVTKGKTKLQVYGVCGNHDLWGDTAYGLDPVRQMANRIPDLIYLGSIDGTITIEGSVKFDGVFHRLLHGAGGIGYTYSAKAEKLLAAYQKEIKDTGVLCPQVLHIGNWHIGFLYFPKELVLYDACFKYKDAFHAVHGLVSVVGLHNLELFTDKYNRLTMVVSNFRNYRPLAQKMLDEKKAGK